MHPRYIFCLIALAVISTPLVIHAAGFGAMTPFGGNVVFQRPCDNGYLLTLWQPGKGVKEFMWNYGELPYSMYVVPHIGQWLLGQSIGSAPCFVGNISYGNGAIIVYHGDSI